MCGDSYVVQLKDEVLRPTQTIKNEIKINTHIKNCLL